MGWQHRIRAMKPTPSSLLLSSALSLASLSTGIFGQGQSFPGIIQGTITPSTVGLVADPTTLPAPPRGAFDQTPPKHGMPDIPVGNGPELAPGAPTEVNGTRGPAAGGLTVYRNTPVMVGSRSVVGEPTCAHIGQAGIQTGNWYAATTSDDGQSWNYVNPYTKFPASDGGFCCDQFTQYVPNVGGTGMVAWLLQYSYSGATQTNRLRIATMRGFNVGSANVSCYVDLTPALASRPAGAWFDFPHMGYSAGWLYVATNVFDGNNNNAYLGAEVFRLNVNQLYSCQSVTYQVFRPQTGSNRFVQRFRAYPEMYFAGHVSTSRLRIHRWDDNGGVSAVDVDISQWYSGTTPVAGPDGRPFTNRADNRIQAGFDNGAHIGFMWYSNQGGSYAMPHVRAAWFVRDTFALAGERSIWNSGFAWAYPSAAPNLYGHLGGSLAYGGGTYYPSTAVWVVDDTNCWGGIDAQTVASGTHGPAEAKWGDYYATQADTLQTGTWLTTAMALSGGTANSNMVPRNVDFGRTNASITYRFINVNSVGVTGAPISMVPNDNFCRPGAAANFTRWYRNGTVVSLTAPASHGGRTFYGWRVNGNFQTLGATTIDVTIGSDATFEAVYGTFTPGTVTPFGTGCRGSANALSLSTGGLLMTGRTEEFKLLGAPSFTAASLFLGVSNTSWNGVPLPLQLAPSNCMVYTDIAVSFPGSTNGAGQMLTNLTVPNLTNLIGSRIYLQSLVVDLLINNPYRITTSNALNVFIGGWEL